MDMGIFMKRNSMKNKPLGFQMWISIALFIVITAIVVSIATIVTIDRLVEIDIVIFNKLFICSLVKLIVCIIIISIIAAKMISNTITEPIRFLERKVRHIASKKWIKIEVDRKDELGKLAYSINKMQNNFEKFDKDEEFFLQSLSHELKTPIMVIKNYCQAIRDGVYINESFEDTIEVIEKEADFLGHKIGKFLYANSLDYILEKETGFSSIELDLLIRKIIDHIGNLRKDIRLSVKLERCTIFGIEEKLSIVIENILENAFRYATQNIVVNLKKHYDKEGRFHHIELSIINDGNQISEDIMEHLFDRFYKGKNGNFGLGLYISKRIVEFHGGNIFVDNLDDSVIFKILLPNKE